MVIISLVGETLEDFKRSFLGSNYVFLVISCVSMDGFGSFVEKDMEMIWERNAKFLGISN